MSDTRRSGVAQWPHVAALRQELAERVMRVATMRQQETGWSDAETVLRVETAATEAIEDMTVALHHAVGMALDVWVAGK